MGFTDPIVGGNGSLILPAIRSPNYQPGVQGWTINRDGSAEFSDLVVTGGEFRVTDPDGSYVRVYDENPGAGAVVDLQPADQPGETFNPAQLRSYSTALDTGLIVAGPEAQGYALTVPQVFLEYAYGSPEPYSVVGILADAIEWNLSELGFAIEGNEDINNGASFSTTSASFVPITGAPTATFEKARTRTRVRLDMSATVQIDNAGTGLEIGLNLDDGTTSTDVFIARWYLAAAGSAGQPFPVTGHRLALLLDAGTYTVTPIMRRYTGAANCIWPSTNGHLSFMVAEVMES